MGKAGFYAFGSQTNSDMPTIHFIGKDGAKELKLARGATIQTLIDAHRLNPELFLISLNGKIAHPATKLSDGDRLEFIHIIYGG